MGAHDKVTPALVEVLGGTAQDDLLEVVVELVEPDNESGDAPAGRAEKIVHLKNSFHEQATPLEEWIASLGGEVLGKAWINWTIHARVPARAVTELARAGSIAAVDTPHQLEPDRPS